MSAPNVPLTQTAVVFYEHNGPLKVVTDHPVRQQKDLKPGEVLVAVSHSGVCHTDLHAHAGDWPAPVTLPLVGGHEGSGHVVAIGDHTQTQLKIGDAVGIKWLADSCLDCEYCRLGFESVCKQAVNSGYTVDGTFQQYAVSYARHLTPIPAGLSMEQAAPILCAGVTVWKAIKEARCKPNDWILISGAGGGLGHLAVQYAAALSLRVLAVDTGKEKEELCAKLGAAAFVDFKDPKALELIKQYTDGEGPHAAIVASGSAAAYDEALDYLRPRGTLVAVGMPHNTKISADVFWTVVKELRIVGSYVGNRQDAIEALDLAARGKVIATIKVEPLASLAAVYEQMKTGTLAGRVVLKCSP
ncbi:hypothetical protein RQP46_001163 [Phenoliferia psychrophenolica]